MKISSLTIFLAVVAFNFLPEASGDKECQEFVKKLLGEQLKHVVPCIEKLGLKAPAEKKEKMFCIMRCVMQEAKMLGTDGKVDFDLVTKMIGELPASMHEKATGLFTECGHHAVSLDPSEPTCGSYGALITCVTEVGVKLCE